MIKYLKEAGRVLWEFATVAPMLRYKMPDDGSSYSLGKTGEDVIYVRKPRSSSYERLDDSFYAQLLAGNSAY
jgi:hypothetical protein